MCYGPALTPSHIPSVLGLGGEGDETPSGVSFPGPLRCLHGPWMQPDQHMAAGAGNRLRPWGIEKPVCNLKPWGRLSDS